MVHVARMALVNCTVKGLQKCKFTVDIGEHIYIYLGIASLIHVDKWNSLPDSVVLADSVPKFKRSIEKIYRYPKKEYIFNGPSIQQFHI